jgi:copper(I)-binding protein
MRIESRPARKRPYTVLLFLVAILGGCAQPAGLVVENARVRSLVPGQDKTVAYMDVHNGTSTAMTLTAARAAEVRTIEFHTTRMDDGVMRMRRLKSVEVPPGGTIQFQPGGRHLMLFGVTSLPSELRIQLEFDDGTVREIPFERIAIGAR